ncbi:cobalamin biosynthesis protein [Ferrimonas pelagia]|uniref:Adenosylcobinamide-phosphate synthase n=1 Tax=Ferrimonas pelagia TaxID=1177826 RepID=A0ABP9ESV7_9GAMM
MATLGPYASLLLPPLILALAYLLALLIPDAYRPRRYLAPLAEAIARKTHHANRSQEQQRIAGALALTVLLLPVGVTLLLLTQVAAYPLPFELLLLAWMMPGPAIAKDTEYLVAYLNAGQKQQARQRLSHWTIRDTAPLSELGLAKASIESQLAHQRNQLFLLILWYCLGGLLLAAIAWCCAELCRYWHKARPGMAAYAGPVTWLNAVLQWPVNLLLAATLTLYGSPITLWHARHQLTGDWQSRNQQWPQLSLACSLHRQLGGPWLLEGQRLLRPRLGPANNVESDDVLRTRRLLSYAGWLWLALAFLLGAALTLLWHHTLTL